MNTAIEVRSKSELLVVLGQVMGLRDRAVAADDAIRRAHPTMPRCHTITSLQTAVLVMGWVLNTDLRLDEALLEALGACEVDTAALEATAALIKAGG